jgi:hypothetical protein
LRTSSAFSVYVRGPNGARDEFILAATALRKDGKADPDAHVKADIENPQRRSAASTLAPLQLLPVFFNEIGPLRNCGEYAVSPLLAFLGSPK